MGIDLDRQEYMRQLGQVAAQAWQDPAFKQRLIENPNAVLAEQGIKRPAWVPTDAEIKIVENTEKVYYIIENPSAVLAEQGIKRPASVPSDAEIKRVKNTGKVYHIVLPIGPGEAELSDADLAKVAGGAGGEWC